MNFWLQNNTFLGILGYEWMVVGLIVVVTYILLLTAWKFSLKRLTAISLKTSTNLDDILIEVLKSTQKLTIALFALLIGFHFLDLPQKWETRLEHLSFLIIGIQIAVWLSKGITIWAAMKSAEKDGDAPNPVITSMLSGIFKAAVWSILLLTVLSNVGVNITAFVASLGIGGVAVALALQNILSDLFASLAIGLDKPFVIGDFVVFGDVTGTIERVGLKTTHIRSISGEQIVCGNTELLKNTIHNYKRMAERRVVFKFGVTYDTDVNALEKIPGIVKAAIELSKDTRFDRAHFNAFGDSSLDFEVVYFINTSDYNIYMNIQQAANLYLLREFQKMGVEFAFPTTTMYIPEIQSALAGSKRLVTER